MLILNHMVDDVLKNWDNGHKFIDEKICNKKAYSFKILKKFILSKLHKRQGLVQNSISILRFFMF